MNASGLVHGMLTVLFTATAVHGVHRAVAPRRAGWRERGDRLLHAAMAITMAAMPWTHGAPLPHPAGTAFFTAAAVWFPVTAVRRGHGSPVAALARSLPPATGMAAMVWMEWQRHAMTGAPHENLAGPPASPHHIGAPGHTAHLSPTAQTVTAALALCLLAYALSSLTRVLPGRHIRPAPATGSIDRHAPYEPFWDGSMALGTSIMLLLHH
ncbi:DUF5134 domain-containing protein [Streptomyces sp. NPDC093223]|uniref:DUF5134 domain-containing protein n=1 Tax=Streptomyces sp. NPDC093223 TaxID=3366033 RepID=UPI0038237FAC